MLSNTDIKQLKDIFFPKFEEIIDRLEAVDQNMVAMEGKIDSLEQKIVILEQKIESLERRIVVLEQRVDSLELKINSLEKRIDGLEQKMDIYEERLGLAENRIEHLIDTSYDFKEILLQTNIKMDEGFRKMEEIYSFNNTKVMAIKRSLAVVGKVLISEGNAM